MSKECIACYEGESSCILATYSVPLHESLLSTSLFATIPPSYRRLPTTFPHFSFHHTRLHLTLVVVSTLNDSSLSEKPSPRVSRNRASFFRSASMLPFRVVWIIGVGVGVGSWRRDALLYDEEETNNHTIFTVASNFRQFMNFITSIKQINKI